jgi:hypothetical protein
VKVKDGDTIHLECTYDNTQAKQPVINGVQAPAHSAALGREDDRRDVPELPVFHAHNPLEP